MYKHLDYNNQISTLKDGFYQLEKDSLALCEFLREVIDFSVVFSSYEEKIKFLIEKGFYENFFSEYSLSEILEVHELVESIPFAFGSYMSAKKFYTDYALKTNDKRNYLETYQDRVKAVSLFLGGGDVFRSKRIAERVIRQQYQPATPTFLNAGRLRRGEFISCFLLELDDSLNSISFNLGEAMYLSKIGGGVAISLSNLRSRGESIKEVENASKGVVPILKIFEDVFNYADQMGQRKGAGACYLNIFHYDIEEFLDTKKINADEKSRIQTLSLGVSVPDKFLEIARENKPFYVFGPHSVYRTFNRYLDDLDMNQLYDRLVDNPNIFKKKLNAREILQKIAKLQFESGYPYLIFIDQANAKNPLKSVGRIKMSNLCTEIFQIQQKSTISDYDVPNELGYDISCVLGSLNLVSIMEGKAIKEAVYAGLEALTAVLDKTSLTNAPTLEKANKMFHSIGLGAMNLHGMFIKNSISYESIEAKDIANVLFACINFYSIRKSMEIAQERGETFEGFKESDYQSGVYFDQYLNEEFYPVTEKGKELFEGIYLPSYDDWKELKEQVSKYGLYHAYRLAIAPTQSISYLQNATQSILPIVDQIEIRTYGNSTTHYPAPYLSRENAIFYKSAFLINQKSILDLVATIQRHVDQGISCILYTDDRTTTRDLVKLYLYAHKVGLKSLYYTRTRNLTVEECLACAT